MKTKIKIKELNKLRRVVKNAKKVCLAAIPREDMAGFTVKYVDIRPLIKAFKKLGCKEEFIKWE